MTTIEIIKMLQAQQALALAAVLITSLLALVVARYGIARGLVTLAARTASRYDDMLLASLHPYRVAWLAPLAVIYASAPLFPAYQAVVGKVALFVILWLSIVSFSALLNAINDIYESRPTYNGVSIQGYLDIAKLIFVLVGLILSITLLTDESPVVLLTSLGAIAAVLMLIFQSTILSLVASIQIAANDLLKEGDWVEVPSYGADGDVININLSTIKIRNFDMTYSIIPTYKIVDVPFRNWRGMQESGGRRMQRSLSVDMITIKFCDRAMLDRLRKIDLLDGWMKDKIARIDAYQHEHSDHYDSPLDGPQITNIEVFRAYIAAYLRSRPDIFSEGRPFLVRALAPASTGLPVELYVFTKTTEWASYEAIQAEVFDHLLAAAHIFDLRVFQEPTGMDFSSYARALAAPTDGQPSLPA